jgi:predicted small secreted protein
MTSRTKVEFANLDLRSAILSFAALLFASLLFLSGCNTLEGAGEDAENAADEVGDAID